MTILHHVSIINRQAEPAFHFYRQILGLDLTMKTVNQDEHRMYHLFFGDKTGRVGTEVTIFEINHGPDKQFGTNQIERLILKVPSVEALQYFEKRFDEHNICHYGIEQYAGRDLLRFDGPDDTGLGLVVIHDDEQVSDYQPSENSDIPDAFRILAIDSVHLRTQYHQATIRELTRMYGFKVKDTFDFFDTNYEVTVLSNSSDFMHHEIHIIHDHQSQISKDGIGQIHHIALSADDLEQLESYQHDLETRNITNSNIKDREFFQSVYYRDPNNLLIEIATMTGKAHEQPNKFESNFNDIPLILPDYLEHQRSQIEQGLIK